jgi:hypothetical protein
MSASKIPTITIGPQVPGPGKKAKAPDKGHDKGPKVQAKPTAKPKTKVKAKTPAKTKARPGARSGARARSKDYSQVPAALAPPEMEDTRPVSAQESLKSMGFDIPAGATVTGVDIKFDQVPSGDITADETKAAPKVAGPVPVDTRLVQGATCTWIGPLDAAPDSPDTGQPVCPHCAGRLITCPDRATLELGLEQFELGAYESINPPPRRHPGYTGLVHWMLDKPTCWTTIEDAAVAYKEETGKQVDPSR